MRLVGTGLSKSFGRGRVLSFPTVTVESGRLAVLVGPSGTGKSTLMALLTGDLRSDAGDVFVYGDDDRPQRGFPHTSWVPQGVNSLSSRSVLDNVAIGAMSMGANRAEATDIAVNSLATVGLEGFRHHRASDLSGGELQRVAVARALAMRCPFLFADEPTGNLDAQNGRAVMDAFAAARESDIAVLVATHDPVAAAHGDVIIDLGSSDGF